MAASTTNAPPSNLAALLLIKRKVAANNGNAADATQDRAAPLTNAGAHSNDKLPYRQSVQIPSTTTTPFPKDQSEAAKFSRQNKQIEVELLEKKMAEIDRKKDIKTNETIEKWKGFDSLNYGFASESGQQKSTTVLSPPNEQQHETVPQDNKQSTPPKTPEQPVTDIPKTPEKTAINTPQEESSRQLSSKTNTPPTSKVSTPKQSNSPINERAISKASSKEAEEELHKETPLEQESERDQSSLSSANPLDTIEKQPSPPVPHSRAPSTSSSGKTKSPIQEETKIEPPKQVVPVFETMIPISSITSNPQIFQTNSPPLEQSPASTSNIYPFRIFPDIKHRQTQRTQKTYQSIQRSMDRYRFHVW